MMVSVKKVHKEKEEEPMEQTVSLPYAVRVKVVHVLKKKAKSVKTGLEECHWFDNRYKICRSVTNGNNSNESEPWLAIPVLSDFNMDALKKSTVLHTAAVSTSTWMQDILAVGYQPCPRSSRHRLARGIETLIYPMPPPPSTEPQSSLQFSNLPILLSILIHAITSFTYPSLLSIGLPDRSHDTVYRICLECYQNQTLTIPKRGLDRIGDDGTILLPQKVFSMTRLYNQINVFPTLIQQFIPTHFIEAFLRHLWRLIALSHASPRLVRKGDIDPDSAVRQSQHVILYPEYPKDLHDDDNEDHHLTQGPMELSPGFITITEQGIKQSFDLTKVMFSRGNISEKIRFGRRLVQPGEIVLDLYAGIGYFTLPAIILGKAKHVYACEWNIHAMQALQHNVIQNRIQDKVTLYHGDSKVFLEYYDTNSKNSRDKNQTYQHHQEKATILQGNLVHRVSLGLLPSSEEGWPVAVQALKRDTGGWLHIHGNVHEDKHEVWAMDVCKRIYTIALEIPWQGNGMTTTSIHSSRTNPVVVLCHHIERVKAFAPHVNHLVLDIFCGPHLPNSLTHIDMKGYSVGLCLSDTSHDGDFIPVGVNLL